VIANYIRLLNKLIESPAEARVVIYMYLLLTPLLVDKLKAVRIGRCVKHIIEDARAFLHTPNQENRQRVQENVRFLESLKDRL